MASTGAPSSDAPSSSHGASPTPWPRRYPVTVLLVGILLGAGLATGSAWHAVPRIVIHDAGFRPSDALALELWRLLSAAWFTTDPWSLVQALALTGLGVGLVERRLGSAWAAGAFLGLHALSFLSLTLLYALPATRGLVRDARDIGASAGYFGTLALALAMTPRWRWLVPAFAIVTVVSWLDTAAAHHVLGRDVNAGAEHLFTLVYGGLAGLLVARRSVRRGGRRDARGPAGGAP